MTFLLSHPHAKMSLLNMDDEGTHLRWMKNGISDKLLSDSPNSSGLHKHSREAQLEVSLEINQKLKGLFTCRQKLRTKNVMPLKDGRTAPRTGHQDKSIDDLPLKSPKWKRKKKFPSTLERDRARIQRF